MNGIKIAAIAVVAMMVVLGGERPCWIRMSMPSIRPTST